MQHLPKMTNLHVHLFALYPYFKLLQYICEHDASLYAKIYCLKTAVGSSAILFKNIQSITTPHGYKRVVSYLKAQIYDELFIDPFLIEQLGDIKPTDALLLQQWLKTFEASQLVKNTLSIFNNQKIGVPFNNHTHFNDWIPYSLVVNENQFVVKANANNAFHQFENIQKMTRLIVRHYKVYYYLWLCSLKANSEKGIYYLNVRGKPGSISTDVAFGTRLYLTAHLCDDYHTFTQKLITISSSDTDIRTNDHKYMYNLYLRVKCESDLILRAVTCFNKNTNKKQEVNDTILTDPFHYTLPAHYVDGVPQMCVQYIITFSKKPRNENIDWKQYMLIIKMTLYVAVCINHNYGFTFFNGYDLVGNEQISHSLEEFTYLINKLFYFRKHQIHFYPHLGESSSVKDEISSFQKYLIDRGINRIGHGMTFAVPAMNQFLANIHKTIYLECCPISNAILGYAHIASHPMRQMINSKHIKPVICSDDNGLFGYDTVTNDYQSIVKYWQLSSIQLIELVRNGIDLIPTPYRKYYEQVFENYLNNNK